MFHAHSLMVTVRRSSTLCLALLMLAGCGGTITFGQTGQEDRDASTGRDATAQRDAAQPRPDAGMADTGVCPPTYPAAWPFERTSAFYKTFIGDWTRTNGCTLGPCHGGMAAVLTPPLFPIDDAALGLNLNQAIDEVWMRITPGGASSVLLLSHKPIAEGGLGNAPAYSPMQTQHLEMVIANAGVCATSGGDAGVADGN
jgi:hypothetical protein